MATGEGQASREIAPAVSGREADAKDPPIMEQWVAEIKQATNYIQTQMCRLRQHSDAIFGSQPVNEKEQEDLSKVAEVRPHYDLMAVAIRDLHNMSGELNEQIERLEGHRLV